MNKVLLYLLAFVLALTLGLGSYYLSLSRLASERKLDETSNRTGKGTSGEFVQTYKGKFICLTRKPGAGPEVEEGCIFGFRDENNRNFALSAKGLAEKFKENAPAQVWGKLDTEVETPYDIVGLIKVSKIEIQ